MHPSRMSGRWRAARWGLAAGLLGLVAAVPAEAVRPADDNGPEKWAKY